MNRTLVLEKLDSIRLCVARVASKTPATLDLLRADIDAQDIICINLERCIQACVDIASHIISARAQPVPSTMAEAFLTLHAMGVLPEATARNLVKSVGLRNLIAHEYRKIDYAIVFDVAKNHLCVFEDFGAAVLTLFP